MANSKRINKNRNGQMLIPMNVDGGVFEDGFFTSLKVCALIGVLLFTGAIILWINDSYMSGLGLFLVIAFTILIDQWVIRYIVFEEKYYYAMYKKMKGMEITTPAVFWSIVSIKETDDGAVMCYSDGKAGILVKVDRDTIIGKSADFKETHFDALSDFYRELNLKGFKFVQMNLMEQAGKDPRLNKLSELVKKTDNKNIAKIVETQIGYIKKITRATLFESDYFLIYRDNCNSTDNLISEALDCVYKLLNGAYISCEVCGLTEVIDVLKEQYGIKYFDYTDAITNMYKNLGTSISKTYSIYEVKYTDGEVEEVNKEGNNRLLNLTSYVNNGTLKFGEWSIKEALKGNLRNIKNNEKMEIGLSLDEIIEDGSERTVIDLDNELFGDTDELKEHKENKISKKILKNRGIHLEKIEGSSEENFQQNSDVNKVDENLYLEDDEVIDLG